MEVKNIRDAAELSMAAYGDFRLGETDDKAVVLESVGMSKSQSERFSANYIVALETYENYSNGFSATVFKNRTDGSLTLGIRGSGVEDWITTNPDIAFHGAAYGQIVELFNWWSIVTTPKDEYARQFTFTDPIEGKAPQLFESFRMGTGKLSDTGDLGLVVTGHSLGGHLAMAFGSLFPKNTKEVVVFNAPGFSDEDGLNSDFFHVLGAAGIPSNNERTTNVIGSADSPYVGDWSIIAGLHGSRPGKKVDIEIEKQWLSDEPDPDGISYDHSIKMLVDSTNVFELLAQLDPALDEYLYKNLFEACSNSESKTLERIVDAISDLIRQDRPKLPTGNLEREALYKAIYAIQDNVVFQKLCDSEQKPDISIDVDLKGRKARNDFGVFLSTVFLSPLVIHANDESADSILKEAYSEMAALWTQDQDSEDGARFYSDQYLEDRTLMRSILIDSARVDEFHGRLSQKTKFTNLDQNEQDTIVFDGDSSGYSTPGRPSAPEFDFKRARYVFGSQNDENPSQIISSENNDRLYGMAGNDSIDGGKGGDYIEGGLGNDELKGGDNSDVLRGGSGNDTLVGGKGVDSLNGGAGPDRFKWYSGDGDDVIVDYDDGGDRIYVNDLDLSTLTFERTSAESPFYVSIEHPEITLHHDGILTINIGGGEGAGSIAVMQYTPATGKDYGIKFLDYIEDWSHPTTITVGKLGGSNNPIDDEAQSSAWWRQHDNQRGLDWSSVSLTFDGNEVPNFPGDSSYGINSGTFEGGSQDDILLGNALGNHLRGLAGGDFIDGRDGWDWIEGFAGSDTLRGGEGQDVIYGSSEILLADYYGSEPDQKQFYLAQALDQPDDINTISGEAGSDIITGGEYTDYIDGGEGTDLLFGGTGEDFISGGVENDRIYGDSALHFFWEQTSDYEATTRWHIAFAAGLDDVGLYDDVIHGGDGQDIVFGELGDDILYGEAGNDKLTGDRDDDTSYYTVTVGGCEDTPLNLDAALHGDDQLFGGAGVDQLRGLGGNDVLIGGEDADFLFGGAGDDIYLLQAGDGKDVIDDDQGVHTLVFNGFAKSDLRIEFQGDQVFVGRGAADSEDSGEGFFISRRQWASTNLALGTADGAVDRVSLDAVYFDDSGYSMFTLKGNNLLSETERDALVKVDTSNPLHPKLVVGAGVEHAQLEGYTSGGGGQLRVTKGTSEYIVGISSIYFRSVRGDIQMPEGLDLVVTGGIYGTSQNDTLIGSNTDDVLWGLEGDDILSGLDGNDTIKGGDGRDLLVGGDGDDTLDDTYDFGDSDYYIGGRGNDLLKGGSGQDRYSFATGDGQDRLIDSGGPHYFEFAPGVNATDVVLHHTGQAGSEFRLEYGAGDSVTTEGTFSVNDIADVTVAGKTIALTQRSDLEDGAFYDTWMNDVFETGSGNDVIHLQGRGVDIYRFHRGDDQDVLKVGEDFGGKFLKGEIHFAADVDLDALGFTFANADAMIGYGSGDRITLDTNTVSSFQDNSLVRFRLVSDTNPAWIPVMRVQQAGVNFYGSYGTDHIIGSDNADTILPGYGDDTVESGKGDDTIVLNDLYQPNAYGSIGKKRISAQAGNDSILAPLYQGITYVYNKGDGNDTIQFDWSYGLAKPYNFSSNQQSATAAFHPNGVDELAFGAGITLADLRFVRYGKNLKISLKDGSGSVMLKEFFHAWDTARSPGAANALYALMDSAKHVNVDTLLNPTVLAALPTTPVSSLHFSNGSVFNMTTGLAAVLEVSKETVSGTEGDDYLYGTAADDVIGAYGGNDYIEDLGGNNGIDAGSGNDTIKVAGGNIIAAGAGKDTITVNGNNIVHAGDDDDSIFVTGNNFLKGGSGRDRIWIEGGNNVLLFALGDGQDIVNFNIGPNATTVLSLAVGIAREDIRVYRNLEDGTEFLTIALPATGDAVVARAMVAGNAGSPPVPHPHATLTEVRFADGTVLTGSELFAMALPSPIQIEGTDGNDTLIGTAADEVFFGGRGDDVMNGAAGNDFFVILGDDQGADIITGGQGIDTIVGSIYDDTITLSAMTTTAGVELISGGEGVNVIAGTSAANSLYFANTRLLDISQIEGRDGDDWIWGSQGNDVIVGGKGNDVLLGEGGNDTFIIAGTDQGTDYIAGGTGTDVVRGSAGDDVISFTTFAAAAGLEVIDGGTGRNSIVGTTADNSLDFSATQLLGIAQIDGKAGNDTIIGSQGGDWLLGDAGNDTLQGGAGNDVFIGGTGTDVLVGDSGDDIYLFALGDGHDQIDNNDMLPTALDRLWLTNVDYDHLWLSRAGDALVLDVVGTNDQVRINHWYTGVDDQLDIIYARNRSLMRNQVDRLVNAMAAFDVPIGVGAVIPQATRMELEATLTSVWKTA